MKRLVRNQITGRILPCCWDDCWSHGDERYRIELPHDSPRFPGEMRVYIFCTERHRELWARGPREHGRLPTGSRGLVGPLGLPLAG